MDAQDKVTGLLKRFAEMESGRAVFNAHWREIAERIMPRSDYFQINRQPGDKHTEKIFDNTATLALDRFGAAMESMLTPRTKRWHELYTTDPDLMKNAEVQTYLDAVTDELFQCRYSPKANFASQAHEVYLSLGAFGTGAMYIDDLVGHGIRYRSIHLSEIYIQENHQGIIDTVFRKFLLTARQAVQKFGAKNVDEKTLDKAEKNPDGTLEYIHTVHPNTDQLYGRKDYKGMPWYSCYIALEGRKIISEGGYNAMPYVVGRYVTGPKEIYGRSPAMTVLADVKMLNEMSKTVIRAAHKIVDPPLLLQEDGALAAFDLRPGALNYGGVSDQGNQLVHALQTGARIDIGLDMMEQRRKTINDAFLVTLFQILVETPEMTATEAMLRAQEKGALLAPTMGRQQSEFLGPMIEREIDILSRAGVLPPMPDVLRRAGGMIEIQYQSPLNKAQRAEEGVAILRTLQAITPLAQIDATVMQVFDPEAIVRELASINGVPQRVLRSPEVIAGMKAQASQAAAAQQLLQAAPVASGVVKDLMQSQSLAASAPNQQAANMFAQQ